MPTVPPPRRRLVLALSLAPLALAACASLRPPPAAARLALLSDNDLFVDGNVQMDTLRAALAEKGYVEGRNLTLLRRNARRDAALFTAQTAEVVAWKPDLFVAASTTAARALKQPATALGRPVVFWSTDPIESGIVPSLQGHGGWLTGVTDADNTQEQVVQLLRGLVPGLRRIGLFYNATYAPAPATVRELRDAAQRQGVELKVYDVPLRVEDFEAPIAAMKADGMQAMVVGPHPFFNQNGRFIGPLVLKHRLPTAGITRSVFSAGGVLAVTPNFRDAWTRNADTIDRILRGARPADLPVVRSTNAILVNEKSLQALGLALSPQVQAQATEVVR